MIDLNDLMEAIQEDSDDKQKYLVIFFTGDAKKGKTVAINDETQEEVPAMIFDIIGPITESSNRLTLKVINNCEAYGKIVVVRQILGVNKKFHVFPSYESWFAERPKNPLR